MWFSYVCRVTRSTRWSRRHRCGVTSRGRARRCSRLTRRRTCCPSSRWWGRVRTGASVSGQSWTLISTTFVLVCSIVGVHAMFFGRDSKRPALRVMVRTAVGTDCSNVFMFLNIFVQDFAPSVFRNPVSVSVPDQLHVGRRDDGGVVPFRRRHRRRHQIHREWNTWCGYHEHLYTLVLKHTRI